MRWVAFFLLFIAWSAPVYAQTSSTVNATVVSIVNVDISTFVTNKTSVPANGSDIATLTATIRDKDSNPLIGRLVAITSSRGQVTDLIRCYSGQILVNSNQAITDKEGKVVCVVSSTTAGTSEYTATCESQTLIDKPDVTFTKPDAGGGTEEPPPPGEEPPPPVDSGPPPEPSPIDKVVDKIVEVPKTLSPIVPGGIGLAVLVPTVALLVPIGSSISVALMAGIPALQYLFLSFWPALRPPRKWGTVRDSSTNTPIPGIFVDLMDAKGNQLKRIMTDRTGRFGFLTPESGKYWVEIKNPLYEPYRTETFDVADFKKTAISFDIILMPLETARVEALRKSARYMKILAVVQIFQLTLLVGGSAVSIYMFALNQNAETSLLIILYSLLWVLRFISSLSYQQSGHIVEIATNNAVHDAIIQVTSMRRGEQEFIHSAVSDERGRFLVLVPPGKYSLIAAKGGYKPVEKRVSGEVQNLNINMERVPLSPSDPSLVATGS